MRESILPPCAAAQEGKVSTAASNAKSVRRWDRFIILENASNLRNRQAKEIGSVHCAWCLHRRDIKASRANLERGDRRIRGRLKRIQWHQRFSPLPSRF